MLVIGAGVHTIVKASKINSTMKIVDNVIRSYKNQLESMIPVITNYKLIVDEPSPKTKMYDAFTDRKSFVESWKYFSFFLAIMRLPNSL